MYNVSIHASAFINKTDTMHLIIFMRSVTSYTGGYSNVLLVLSVGMSCLEEVVVKSLLERTPDQGVRGLALPLILGLPESFDFLIVK